MGTSLGAAIDYLTAPALLTALQAVDKAALLVDNVPTSSSQSMVFIGRTDPGNAQANNGAQTPITLGLGSRDEEYAIPCYISASRPGPDQKPARDAAIALFDVVAHYIAQDTTLGGVLKGGRYAWISTILLEQTLDPADSELAGGQRIAYLSFDVLAHNHYQP
jgi:hypothetical protein